MSTPAQKLLTLEDLSVGQKFHTRTHALDETQIKNFASQFDPQPFHLDDDAAKKHLLSRTCCKWLAHSIHYDATHG